MKPPNQMMEVEVTWEADAYWQREWIWQIVMYTRWTIVVAKIAGVPVCLFVCLSVCLVCTLCMRTCACVRLRKARREGVALAGACLRLALAGACLRLAFAGACFRLAFAGACLRLA